MLGPCPRNLLYNFKESSVNPEARIYLQYFPANSLSKTFPVSSNALNVYVSRTSDPMQL